MSSTSASGPAGRSSSTPTAPIACRYSTSYALIRRLAKRAGIAGAARISPHSLRHSFATELLANGVPLQDVQDAMGHADPRTTRAYDRSRHNLDRHPTYTMAAQLHRTRTPSADDETHGTGSVLQ